eukprot:m.249374 g.249374  ORF g.249374 m.249374 type:complete len:129 (-) comp54499_c1_seq9:3193-3579(-)
MTPSLRVLLSPRGSALSLTPDETTPRTKQGWLKKKGGGSGLFSRTNWKLRWFILRDGWLTYQKDRSDSSTVLGVIDARDIESFHLGKVRGVCTGFSILTSTRTYYLACRTDAEGQEWIKSLKKACISE